MIREPSRTERPRVALVTCHRFPYLVRDDRRLIEPLARRGIAAEAVVWDAGTECSSFALAVLRTPWDYTSRCAEFVAWAATVPRLLNPADVVAWNTDKCYLRELAADGVPVVPTTWLRPEETWSAPGSGEFVIKPSVGSGAKDAGRYDLGRAEDRRLAAAHVARLQRAGRSVMVQPYLEAVETLGETCLVFLGDEAGRLAFSHAVRKEAMLDGPAPGPDAPYPAQSIAGRQATAAELALAGRVLAAVPGGADRLLYARIDLIPGADGAPRLLELELTEPSLFLGEAADAADRFAAAIAARLADPAPADRRTGSLGAGDVPDG